MKSVPRDDLNCFAIDVYGRLETLRSYRYKIFGNSFTINVPRRLEALCFSFFFHDIFLKVFLYETLFEACSIVRIEYDDVVFLIGIFSLVINRGHMVTFNDTLIEKKMFLQMY